MATVMRVNQLAYKELVDETLWTRLVNRLVEDEDFQPELAERIMNEALGFLKLCAEHPGNGFSPAPMVDEGWHTFILYTREYAEFCDRVAGHFIHHNPTDMPGASSSSGLGITGTLQFMVDNDYPVDVSLWVRSATVDCTEGWGERCEAQCNDGPRE